VLKFFFIKKFQSQTVTREKLDNTLLFKKDFGDIDNIYKATNMSICILSPKKLQSQIVIREKLRKALLYKKMHL
jgi:hypothetical protein